MRNTHDTHPRNYLHLPNRIAYDPMIYTEVDAYIQKHTLEHIWERFSSSQQKINNTNPLAKMISILEDTQQIYANNFTQMKHDLMLLVPHLKTILALDAGAMKSEIADHIDIRKDLVTHNILQQIHLYENHRIGNWNIAEALSTEKTSKAHTHTKKLGTQLTLELSDGAKEKNNIDIVQLYTIDKKRTTYLTRLLVFLLLEDELQ